ncbi:FkbM family methyltransferase [Rubrivivax sp. RP6-9]|uniref:FkbM family methyltransferase n=1 Tax=Rubrivivax sp. RP6-9 TaxID=3415750 RepID=UPI003CC597CD
MNAIREQVAHGVAGLAARISPFWRFRLWARMVGRDPYRQGLPSMATRRRVEPHGYEMDLFETDWMERYALRCGHFYQDEIVALLAHLLRPGDVVVDVGANIGFVSLAAVRLVGPGGHVHAFEPNPVLVRRLRKSIAHNDIRNLSVTTVALGAQRGIVRLVAGAHHGTTRITVGDEAPGQPCVKLERGDDLLRDKLPAHVPVLVKIDVEGAELGVLQGMPDLLRRPRTRFYVELGDTHARRFGSSAAEVFALFRAHGYTAHTARLSPLRPVIQLRPLAGPLAKPTYDVLFTPAP